MRRILLCLVTSMFFANAAFAVGVGTGKIARIYSLSGGSVIVGVDNYSGGPSCSDYDQFAFDGTTTEGKNILATLMVAKTSNYNVYIRGYGNCDTLGNREELRYVYID